MAKYKLTEVSDVTNAGYNSKETIFDTWDELQDYIIEVEAPMSDDERELHSYYSEIEEQEG